MSVKKVLQRRIYSLLSDKSTFIAFLTICGFVSIAIISFGQTWMEWSSEKYAALADSFSDNIIGRSMRGRLCQYIPIDVVYTWVNGSDPWFLDDLKHAKEAKWASEGNWHLERIKTCNFGTCVPSHMATLDRLVPPHTRLSLVKEQNSHLRHGVALKQPKLVCGSHVENRTVVAFENSQKSLSALNESDVMSFGFEHYNMTQAYWTTEWTIPNSFPMDSYFMVLDLPVTATEDKIYNALPSILAKSVTKIWLHSQEKVAVIHSSNETLVKLFLDGKSKFHFSSGVEVGLSPANLIIELPRHSDDENFQPKRFADYDQLRYSIRSLEKFAPWVRSIFIVTNGQIPHWLNLDNPKVRLVTHEEIFEDRSHLPTFSSPSIEANLHRIPGISERFLYFNDDVFLGKEVWPEDFYTEHEGFKVRWGWPLPDCDDNCPRSWLNDGFCDVSCNTTKCMYDGGDCIGSAPRMGFGDQDRDHAFHFDDDPDQPLCNQGCLDSWLADKFCDESCNVPECGYDAADCGVKKFGKFHQQPFDVDVQNAESKFIMADGETITYWNLSSIFRRFEEVGLVPSEHRAIRALSLSDEHEVMMLIVRENMTVDNLNFTLQAKSNSSILIHDIHVSCNSVDHVPVEADDDDIEDRFDIPLNVELKNLFVNDSFSSFNIDEQKFNLSYFEQNILNILKQQLRDEEITMKGFRIKKLNLLIEYVKKHLNSGGDITDLVEEEDTVQQDGEKAIEANPNDPLEPKVQLPNGTLHRKDLMEREPQGDDGDTGNEQAEARGEKRKLLWAIPDDLDFQIPRVGQRRLLDAYGDSLLHVNSLLTESYGFAARSVPAHIPHFVDLEVLHRIIGKYHDEWVNTSSHRFRQGDDLQFAFTYTHYIINEKKKFSAAEIFDEFDTDLSGTWSDREIRTLLAKMHSLPLYLETINVFEAKIIKCSQILPHSVTDVEVPPFERYFDSALSTVSRELIVNCPEIADHLATHFRDRNKYKHKVIENNEDSSFKRLSSNLSQVVKDLDDLRKNSYKFVCINDETDPTRPEDNLKVHAFLIDFFESILPVPSSFELPHNLRNKFSHVEEFRRHDFYRVLLRWASMISLAGLIITLCCAYFGFDLIDIVMSKCALVFQRHGQSGHSRIKNHAV